MVFKKRKQHHNQNKWLLTTSKSSLLMKIDKNKLENWLVFQCLIAVFEIDPLMSGSVDCAEKKIQDQILHSRIAKWPTHARAWELRPWIVISNP